MKKYLLPSLLLILVSLNLSAAEDNVVVDKTKAAYDKTKEVFGQAKDAVVDATETVTDKIAYTQIKRGMSDYYVLGAYSAVDLLIPGKYGITVGLNNTVDRTWEFEYLRGSYSLPFILEDLGEMKDERFSLMTRSYSGRNSFHISYGLSYFKYSIKLGNEIISRVPGANASSVDLIELESLGANFGIGNRWAFRNGFTIGVDWLAISQPIFMTKKRNAFMDYATNEDDKKNIEKAGNTIAKFPRFTAFKVQMGYTF